MSTLRRRPRFWVLGFVGLLVASACSSSSADDGTLPPLSAESSTTSSSTSSSSTTTTSAPISTSSSSSSTTEPVSPSIEKPDLEIPTEWDSDLDEIFGRYLLYWEALDIALGPPEAHPDYRPLRELTSEPFYAEIAEQIEEIRVDGLVAVAPPGSLDNHNVRLPNPAPLSKTEGNEVTIQDCWVFDQELQSLDGEVVETLFLGVLRNVQMKVIEGEWRVFASVDAAETSAGFDECQGYFNSLAR